MASNSFEIKHLAWLALFAALAIAPMVFQGMPGGDDAGQHYEFSQHVVDAWRSGEIFPSFAGNANRGFGDVGLRIYPPVAYYLLAGAYVVCGDWFVASLGVFFLIFFVGAVGVFFWSREFFDVTSSLVAASLFTFAPFHLNEIYNNFLFAEFAAGSVLPFCFLFLTRTARDASVANILLLSISYAVLVCTHLPLTIIGSISLAIYGFALVGVKNVSRYVGIVLSIGLGVILSSFYWVRMLTEMDWVKHSRPEYFSKIWSYDENFLLSVRTFTDFMNDGQALWFGDLMLVATVVLSVPAIVWMFRSKRENALIALFATGVFFATPLSMLVWKLLPSLQKVQFPWRWLNIVSLAASVIAGAGLVAIGRAIKASNNTKLSLAVAAAVLPFSFVSAFVVRAPHFTPRAEFNAKSITLSSAETFEGWWPAWASKQAFSQHDNVVADGRGVTVERWSPTERRFSIDAGAPATAKSATFYYPHWHAKINGNEVPVEPSANGTIALQISDETSLVELRFLEPPSIVASIWVSIAGWLACLVTLAFIIYRRSTNHGINS